jgi:hypothetical protein
MRQIDEYKLSIDMQCYAASVDAIEHLKKSLRHHMYFVDYVCLCAKTGSDF